LWDVILIEIDLADQCGLDFLIYARRLSPGVRMLAMSSGDEAVEGPQAVRAGSAGYFHRSGSAEDLLKAIAKILEGRHYISRRLADALARNVDAPHPGSEGLDHTLSPREAQILGALANGESIKKIGGTLGISPKTVSTYRRRILEKMRFRNDADIVKYWWSRRRMVALSP
jgi:DNA-binding NarL/FixJ family response regulator